MSNALDHIVLLLSPHDFQNVSPWLSNNFNIIEGGTHSKGTSRNKLIVFKDGTYLELFSWIDPQPDGVPPHADFPSWADKPEGYIIDWALTGDDARANYDGIMQRLDKWRAENQSGAERIDITYNEPASGGRKRKDGQELQWVTTRPRVQQQQPGNTMPRLEVPFFCHDVTARNLRVPFDNESITTHPCGAIGVSHMDLDVPEEQYEQYVKLYLAILGLDEKETTSDRPPDPENHRCFNIAVPAHDLTGEKPHHFSLNIFRESERRDTSNSQYFKNSGLGARSLGFRTEHDDRKGQHLGGLDDGLAWSFSLT
ncbi:hypothetical protein H2198_009423 [Neophaeococcomyces mojaviensis]|uniref:Uncharacterized protein n=1 Tax=Neophaeococcomyces mojaviensis TaxID=3383035 RepID=A0ACC2ZUG1_9EURO|nr:hypothetical protein H2198_009423 [Knufia sp. JES_112]